MNENKNYNEGVGASDVGKFACVADAGEVQLDAMLISEMKKEKPDRGVSSPRAKLELGLAREEPA